MAFQFIHVQCIARSKPKKISTGSDTKWTVSDIAGEAMRVAENSPHVKNPSPPVIVFGLDAFQVVAEANLRAEASKDLMNRKIRADTPIMLAGVASHQTSSSELSDPSKLAEYEFWKKETLSFLQKKYGESLLSVIEHKDEKFPHLHFYVVPPAEIGFNAKKMHDGFAAGSAAGKNMPLQKQLYCDAMRAFQDEYQAQVGVKCGQARLGPQRARLSRAQWLTQQVTMRRAAEVFQTLDRRIRAQLATAKKAANSIIRDAKTTASGAGMKMGAFLGGVFGRAPELIHRYKHEAEEARTSKKAAEAAKTDSERREKLAISSKNEAVKEAVKEAVEPLKTTIAEERDLNFRLNLQNREIADELKKLKRNNNPSFK